MATPSTASIAVAIASGLLHVLVVAALYARAAYPTLESTTATGSLAVTAFAFGFIAVLVTVHTRLLSPAIGFLSVLCGTAAVELTTPSPTWGELDGYVIVEGPTHVADYANAWYVFLALCLFAGVVEFGLRRGYEIGDDRLRYLPGLPLSPYVIGWIAVGFGGLVGVATTLLVVRSGVQPGVAVPIVFVFATAVAAVPLVALLSRGLLLPVLLFAGLVPYVLLVDVFTTTDSPVHLLLFGPYAVVLSIAWGVESLFRSRFRGWDGGRFAGASIGSRVADDP